MNARLSLQPRSFTARYAGTTVLAIGAHPDDLELGIGGTLARLSHGGARVVMAVVSVPADYETRRREAEDAAKILGCELRFLLDGACHRIEDVKRHELVSLIDGQVRELAPSAVLTHSASEFHMDHVAVYNACVSSQRLSYFDFFSFHPTMCRPVPMPFHPRAYVDVTPTIDLKMAAIEAHASQFSCRGISTELFREIAHLQGHMAGVPYAEGLDVARMVLA
jgi:LmbE family N-acetylglucosaminyl deacetylase